MKTAEYKFRLDPSLREAFFSICKEQDVPASQVMRSLMRDYINQQRTQSTVTYLNRPLIRNSYKFLEFFAGGGMARAGLGTEWRCMLANDIDRMKAKTYANNWGKEHLLVKDVALLTTNDIPGQADLSWASFPCQDLSLAGAGAGIRAKRSGTFWPFWQLMRGLVKEERGPKIIVLENVYGALTSHKSKDFSAIGSAFSGVNYRFGAVIIDAMRFLPQSRKRLFIIGIRSNVNIPDHLQTKKASSLWHPSALTKAHANLSIEAAKKWVWWNLPQPQQRHIGFSDIIEDKPISVKWHSKAETRKLLSMMSRINLDKVKAAQKTGKRIVAGVYKRTRNGVQCAEVRIDDISGCLRTPSGGSSRQTILVIEGENIRSRLLSSREAARLMGLPDDYQLPGRYNDAYHLAGDGVAVPVVRFLSENILLPILEAHHEARNVA